MTLWSSEVSTESSYNGVLGIGLDSPEVGGWGRRPHTGGGRSLVEWVVGISQDKYQQAMDLRATGTWERVL